MGTTLAQKIWDRHLIDRVQGRDLLYMDLHLVHELSPQAFGGLDLRGLRVRQPSQTVATMDHNVPTGNRNLPVRDPLAATQLRALRENCARNGVPLFGLGSRRQGIVHVLGPETGLTLPGLTMACGDSHTATHGAFGALAFGIGTTQVEQVLATQCLLMPPLQHMAVEVEGGLSAGVTAKDLALAVVNTVGFGGASGHIIEYRGSTIRSLSMEGRLTLCNMSAEAGARAGLIAPDETTIEFVRGRRYAPEGEAWDQALCDWADLHTDDDAQFVRTIRIDATQLEPTITWGTTPAMSVPVSGRVPTAQESPNRAQTERALEYMGLSGGERITDLPIDRVFIGSCTNSRIEDLRAAASVVAGHKVADGVRAMVVPGSMPVKKQAEEEGLHTLFQDAGFEWREPGCSMCLGMNEDVAAAGERIASTSNRNFEGRQGAGARTHLLSPEMAAAAAVAGHFVDVREVL
ncbi:3-isopropylmalate dehydratase large subunit [Arthrobacter crystallopoietes]|uniref:3-isopropylmalate dehydratase large subunit n=1 Tax=Crystallibacter crystallopoietes TaxID=37928 RepID=A0A1H1I0H5_9MICC|nr:3-isopropylmalate dehydratase large subunit [Arthrobacter crystallopoietes]AUI53752.1 3-isopropylmalate dehydratase large subunit [Arthrobacter crystallopoietes]SDR28943.1 3-isopropylmalate dehydratase, large subunit [Arthrobacter crystallopoietes]SDR31215.1 3-isopropylmalate/(R)-2-methylmalate dehydratase large subunit [Arthrobacter crystallopoietes]